MKMYNTLKVLTILATANGTFSSLSLPRNDPHTISYSFGNQQTSENIDQVVKEFDASIYPGISSFIPVDDSVCDGVFQADRCKCTWNKWGEWSECSIKDGKRFKTRTVYKKAASGGTDCKDLDGDGHNKITEDCPINCVWGKYGEWTECDAEGKQNRTRNPLINAININLGAIDCNLELDSTECRDCKKDCQWGQWEKWDECSKDGVQRRFRSVVQQPLNGGRACDPLEGIETKTCPVKCEVSQWSEWCDCSNGLKSRRRYIMQDA